MLCVFYLRRRLVFVGLLLWITTLLFAYSFLVEDADMREPTNNRFKTIMKLQELRINPPYQMMDHIDAMSSTAVPEHVDALQEAKNVKAKQTHLDVKKKAEKVSIVKRDSMSHDADAVSRDTHVMSEVPPMSDYCNRDDVLAASQEGKSYVIIQSTDGINWFK
ncbi:uncharacterized protein LOC125384220 [Haliotis rufescens]|uniref:uncharacterized protein LOC125384220 n=1 Tax=Haliotis rufescens TaxID=6454 RepID=UPI00201FA725|nr:uncharacterized protein LOC125384220 [Haliotis rufescens]